MLEVNIILLVSTSSNLAVTFMFCSFNTLFKYSTSCPSTALDKSITFPLIEIVFPFISAAFKVLVV